MEALGIDHVLLLVEDLSESVAFYEAVVGCTVEHRLPQYAMVELMAGASHIDLVDIASAEGAWARPAVAGGRNVHHVAVAVAESGECVREHLSNHGIAIDEERLEGSNLSLYVRDPSNNTIELICR